MNKMLPKGWILTKLANVTTHPQYGWTCSSTNSGSLKLLRTTDISDGKINWETVPYCSIEPKDYNKYLIQNNDILVSRAGSVGISYRISESDLLHPTVFASYLIRFCPFIPPNFVEHYFKSHHYWHYISDSQLGIAVPNVNATKLSDLPFPLPPLDEQKRIVDKLDQIILRIDLLKERLDKIPAIIKRFRQSVLTAAVTGQMTEKWREGRPELERVEELLERRIKESHAIKITSINYEDPIFDSAWNFLKLGVLFSKGDIFDGPFGSNLKTSDYTSEGVRVIRLENIEFLSFNNNKKTYISKSKYENLKRHTVFSGDIIFSSFISDSTRTVLLPELDEISIAKADCFCLRTNEQFINNKYLTYILSSKHLHDYLQTQIHGATRPRINTTQLRNTPIPYPPLEEQKEIVRQVDKLFALADKLESHYQKAKARVDKLSQSILAKAFRGELVITEAELAEKEGRDFESAEKLLERILEEKAKLTGSKKSPRVRKKIKQGNERNNK